MDSLIAAASHALATGDPLGALKRVALREDAPALALRGIAMAQLGELERARLLLRRAARAFGPREAVSKAKCMIAEAEVSLAARDLGWSGQALARAQLTLDAHGDKVNAAHARYLGIRRLVLLGRIDEADRALRDLDEMPLPAVLRVAHALLVAGIAMRRVQARAAHQAVAQARVAATDAGVPALSAEVDSASHALRAPAGRLIRCGHQHALVLADVETLLGSHGLIVDACGYVIRAGRHSIPLARRPVLFALARALAEGFPADLPRDTLVARVFGIARADESLRARLRVEIGRLRTAIAPAADVRATASGFLLVPRNVPDVCVLAPPVEHEHAAVLALLADGESWSSSALAMAMSVSQRTIQRALDALAQAGAVHHVGRGRARRWMMPPTPGIATMLLLPGVVPNG